MSATAAGSTIDLEKELTCSICTDVFYQPLTLLDCLHTFCGSCVKEWFALQATTATHRNASPYTCPSCRAAVRAARPNANVTSLLEMYLMVNPTKGKTEDEKADMRKNYQPGDDVIPPVEVHTGSEDSEDERLLDDVMQMSVADLNPGVEANRRAMRERDRRERERDREERRQNAANARRRQEAVERNVAHQPSLRSLLSAAGADSTEVQEVLATILSSGVLDGVDVDNLTPEQEDELAERITEAYHRRHAARARDHRPSDNRAQIRSSTGDRNANSRQSTPPRSRPAVPHTNLIEQWTQETSPSHRREHRQREASTASHSGVTTTPEPPPAIRSATDPTSRNTDESTERRRVAVPSSRSNTNPPPAIAPTSRRDDTPSRDSPHRTPPYPVEQLVQSARLVSSLTAEQRARHLDSSMPYGLYALPIPVVSCNSCGKSRIQHDLHYHCSKCADGDYDICLRCYRTGKGCNHWFGFGYGSITAWRKSAPPNSNLQERELPHVLTPRRYVRRNLEQGITENALNEGAFCEGCFQYTDKAYWHCNYCLEGAWGYCLACVQQEKHCTHPLAPVTRIQDSTKAQSPATGVRIPLPHLTTDDYYFDMAPTVCAISGVHIPPEHTRFHCTQCNNGNYDISNEAYHSLVATGKINAADGPSGRRRCLRGHAMSVVTFRHLAEGIKQRVVVSEPVGGWQSRHEANTDSKSHGHLRALALWSWWPADGVEDELAFPKFAELNEVEKINADYYAGVYAGSRGLFPANHVREL